MSDWSTKVYVIQKFDAEGKPGEVIDVKLTFNAAHMLAKAHAPAKIGFFQADKKPVVSPRDQARCS